METPSNQVQSMLSADAMRWAASAPERSATSLRRTELEELAAPITRTSSASSAIAFTASCRLVVA